MKAYILCILLIIHATNAFLDFQDLKDNTMSKLKIIKDSAASTYELAKSSAATQFTALKEKLDSLKPKVQAQGYVIRDEMSDGKNPVLRPQVVRQFSYVN